MVPVESPPEVWPVVPKFTGLEPEPKPNLVAIHLPMFNPLGPIIPAAVAPTLAKPDNGDMHIVCFVDVGTV